MVWKRTQGWRNSPTHRSTPHCFIYLLNKYLLKATKSKALCTCWGALPASVALPFFLGGWTKNKQVTRTPSARVWHVPCEKNLETNEEKRGVMGPREDQGRRLCLRWFGHKTGQFPTHQHWSTGFWNKTKPSKNHKAIYISASKKYFSVRLTNMHETYRKENAKRWCGD